MSARFVTHAILVVATAAVTLAVTYASGWLNKPDRPTSAATVVASPVASAPKTPLERFAQTRHLRSVAGDVVFVTKGVFGGDLSYNAILKGRLRNVSARPHKDVFVVWILYGPDQSPFATSGTPKGPSVFLDKVDYLDSKAEADFSISLDLHAGLSIESARKVRQAIDAGRHEAGLYVKEAGS